MAQKASTLQVRMSEAERSSFLKASQLSGLTMSAWVRQCLRRQAITELQSYGVKIPIIEEIGEFNAE